MPRLQEEKDDKIDPSRQGAAAGVPGSAEWKREKEVVEKLQAVQVKDKAVEEEGSKTQEAPLTGQTGSGEAPVVEAEDDSKKPSKNAKKREAKARYAAEQKALKAAQAQSQSASGSGGVGIGGEEDEGQKMEGPGHAAMGRKWLKIHLERVGKGEKDLAEVLWREGISCILEVSLAHVRWTTGDDRLMALTSPSPDSYVTTLSRNTSLPLRSISPASTFTG